MQSIWTQRPVWGELLLHNTKNPLSSKEHSPSFQCGKQRVLCCKEKKHPVLHKLPHITHSPAVIRFPAVHPCGCHCCLSTTRPGGSAKKMLTAKSYLSTTAEGVRKRKCLQSAHLGQSLSKILFGDVYANRGVPHPVPAISEAQDRQHSQ